MNPYPVARLRECDILHLCNVMACAINIFIMTNQISLREPTTTLRIAPPNPVALHYMGHILTHILADFDYFYLPPQFQDSRNWNLTTVTLPCSQV